MNIPEAEHTVGDKVYVILHNDISIERKAEGIVHSVNTINRYGVNELFYTVFILDEDCCFDGFSEDDLSKRTDQDLNYVN